MGVGGQGGGAAGGGGWLESWSVMGGDHGRHGEEWRARVQWGGVGENGGQRGKVESTEYKHGPWSLIYTIQQTGRGIS